MRRNRVVFFSFFQSDETSRLCARERSIRFRVIYLFIRVNIRTILRYQQY